jgi:ribosomal protein L12E/L44/L45/RPP1/RPP2
VAIVIFVPQSVTMFLDKEIVVDIDKVKIEVPAEAEAASKDPADALKAITSAPATTGTAAENAAADLAATSKAAEKEAEEEQKKLDELFKEKK